MKIPKALDILKKNTNPENWDKCKRNLISYLSYQRDIESSNLSLQRKHYLMLLVLADHKQKDFFVGNWDYIPDNMSKENIISHALNVLSSLSKRPYDSEMVCYIDDSYNTVKSGNTKYL